jgi:hypothetical protein
MSAFSIQVVQNVGLQYVSGGFLRMLASSSTGLQATPVETSGSDLMIAVLTNKGFQAMAAPANPPPPPIHMMTMVSQSSLLVSGNKVAIGAASIEVFPWTGTAPTSLAQFLPQLPQVAGVNKLAFHLFNVVDSGGSHSLNQKTIAIPVDLSVPVQTLTIF